MVSSQPAWARPARRPFIPDPPLLTGEDWRLILQALNAYQHHTAFRAIHDKIVDRLNHD